MTKDEFAELSKPVASIQLRLTSSLFSENSADRTLLYGYDCDRNTWHVYLKDDEVNVFVHSRFDEEEDRRGVRVNYAQTPIVSSGLQSIIPNKRLYPEACDLDFCHWLKSQGIYLPFVQFDETRPRAVFYGEL